MDFDKFPKVASAAWFLVSMSISNFLSSRSESLYSSLLSDNIILWYDEYSFSNDPFYPKNFYYANLWLSKGLSFYSFRSSRVSCNFRSKLVELCIWPEKVRSNCDFKEFCLGMLTGDIFLMPDLSVSFRMESSPPSLKTRLRLLVLEFID